MAIRTIDSLARQAENIGYQPDENKIALTLAGMNKPEISAIYGKMISYRAETGNRPLYLTLIEQNSNGHYSGRDFGRGRRNLTVHAGGVMALYFNGNKLYQGFFGKGGKPLEEEGKIIQKAIFGQQDTFGYC